MHIQTTMLQNKLLVSTDNLVNDNYIQYRGQETTRF